MHPDVKKERPIGYLVHEVARLFRRRFEEEARAHGLTLAQWRTLGAIHWKEAVTQVELAGYIDADPMTVSGILDRLEKRGLIERYAHPEDSRAKLSRLTAEGMELVGEARHVGFELYQNALAGLSEAERDTLISGLTRMRDNLNNLGPEADQEKEAV
ncbi:MarR family transcriptional regulator [Devosia yakushimensis]|uniref:MarR family transcriptional regulator n=1 Tax=Devosia yakushimensis TaxID=470028 RepID=A0ABQ5UBV4_9HYPH|nr:MarR family transcriptional regulator [Devosia yakushimensis]GLQ08665.1 MarR family transcriptional regulator [Devosia yakushimensis]